MKIFSIFTMLVTLATSSFMYSQEKHAEENKNEIPKTTLDTSKEYDVKTYEVIAVIDNEATTLIEEQPYNNNESNMIKLVLSKNPAPRTTIDFF